MVKRILILGGTTEAAELARRASFLKDVAVISSLAGRTTQPALLAGEVRVGGFGGVTGLMRFLRQERIDAVIDATHPFAERISANAEEACQRLMCPRLVLIRPAWVAQAGDLWRSVPDIESAVSAIETGARAFLTVGRQELTAFTVRSDVRYLARVIDLPQSLMLPPNFQILTGRGPFSVTEEHRIFTEYQVTCLVTKNSGGDASYAKMIAAREAGMQVIVIDRPPPPRGEFVETVEEVLPWLDSIFV